MAIALRATNQGSTFRAGRVCEGPLASNLSVSSHLAQKIATITGSVVDYQGRNRRNINMAHPPVPEFLTETPFTTTDMTDIVSDSTDRHHSPKKAHQSLGWEPSNMPLLSLHSLSCARGIVIAQSPSLYIVNGSSVLRGYFPLFECLTLSVGGCGCYRATGSSRGSLMALER